MLDFMRSQAQGWIVKVLFALIVMSFALWGVGDYFSGQQAVTVANVGDKEITQQSLEQRTRSERNRLRRLLGENFDPEQFSTERIRDRALEQLIRENLLDLEVNRLGLMVPDAAIQEAIQSQSVFQQGGSFSPQRYRNILDRMGLGASEYESRMRQDLMASQLRRFLQGATLVSEEEVWKAFQRQQEERRVRYFRLAAAQFTDQVSLSEEAVQTFYEDHSDRYRRPAQVRVRYVVLSPESVATRFEPTEAQLRAYLEEHGDRYAGEEGEIPELSEVRDRVASDWRADRAADWIFERLPTFKDLLYTRDDLTAASEEFDLQIRTSDWISEGQEPAGGVPRSQEFLEKAFSLEPGENSRAIELGDARFAGLQVVEERPATVRPLEAVRGEVRQDLRRVRSQELAAEKAREAAEALSQGRGLDSLAEDHGAQPETVGPATRRQARSDWPSGLAAAAFGVAQGSGGSIALGTGEQAVYEVAEITQPDRGELSDNQRQELRDQLRRSRGEARMEAYFDRLRQRYEVRIREAFRSSEGRQPGSQPGRDRPSGMAGQPG